MCWWITWHAQSACRNCMPNVPDGLKSNAAVWYGGRPGGNNSVVECDLAKVEVAGSNPVSRSNLRSPASRASYGRRARLGSLPTSPEGLR